MTFKNETSISLLATEQMIHDGIFILARDVMILSAFILALYSHKMTPVVGSSSVVSADLLHHELRTLANLLHIKPSVIEQSARLKEVRRAKRKSEKRRYHSAATRATI